MSNYIGWEHLASWAYWAEGNEKIGVGIRPYGLHAGNLTAVVAYPYLICEQFKNRQEKEPNFTFQTWLNDIEPVSYVGADGQRESANAANMYPEGTTFQFAPAPDGFPGSLVDYWQPVIEGIVRGTIGTKFPDVTLEFRRASELVTTSEFKKMVHNCTKDPDKIGKIVETNTYSVIQGANSFVWPLCSKCHTPILKDLPVNKNWLPITWSNPFKRKKTPVGSCEEKHQLNGGIKNCSWATQFRMLQTVRLAVEQPDLWVMGIDHYQTNRGLMFENLAESFGLKEYKGSFLHTPLVFANGEKKISKSLGNAVYMDPMELVDILRENKNKGVDIGHAPASSDIMVVGDNLLPEHLLKNKAQRKENIRKERAAYEASGDRDLFTAANAPRAINNKNIANIVGVPHL